MAAGPLQLCALQPARQPGGWAKCTRCRHLGNSATGVSSQVVCTNSESFSSAARSSRVEAGIRECPHAHKQHDQRLPSGIERLCTSLLVAGRFAVNSANPSGPCAVECTGGPRPLLAGPYALMVKVQPDRLYPLGKQSCAVRQPPITFQHWTLLISLTGLLLASSSRQQQCSAACTAETRQLVGDKPCVDSPTQYDVCPPLPPPRQVALLMWLWKPSLTAEDSRLRDLTCAQGARPLWPVCAHWLS